MHYYCNTAFIYLLSAQYILIFTRINLLCSFKCVSEIKLLYYYFFPYSEKVFVFKAFDIPKKYRSIIIYEFDGVEEGGLKGRNGSVWDGHE